MVGAAEGLQPMNLISSRTYGSVRAHSSVRQHRGLAFDTVPPPTPSVHSLSYITYPNYTENASKVKCFTQNKHPDKHPKQTPGFIKSRLPRCVRDILVYNKAKL